MAIPYGLETLGWNMAILVAASTKAYVCEARFLGFWVRILPVVWMFVLRVLEE